MKLNKKLKKIIVNFGEENQMKKLLEECNELIFAYKDNTEKEIFEEAVDVLIMIKQIFLIFGKSKKDVQNQIDYKINRTLKRIKTGYYEKN